MNWIIGARLSFAVLLASVLGAAHGEDHDKTGSQECAIGLHLSSDWAFARSHRRDEGFVRFYHSMNKAMELRYFETPCLGCADPATLRRELGIDLQYAEEKVVAERSVLERPAVCAVITDPKGFRTLYCAVSPSKDTAVTIGLSYGYKSEGLDAIARKEFEAILSTLDLGPRCDSLGDVAKIQQSFGNAFR